MRGRLRCTPRPPTSRLARSVNADLAAEVARALIAERERCTWVAHSWTVPWRIKARFPGMTEAQLALMLALASAIAEDLASGRSSSPEEATL